MDGNEELLNYALQNAQMGMDTIDQLMGVVNDSHFQQMLNEQRADYEGLFKQAETMLQSHGMDEKQLSKMDKMKTDMMITLQTLKDKSVPHLAEMMVLGSNMGVVDALKNLRKYPNASPEIRGLMDQLKKVEENNAERMKPLI